MIVYRDLITGDEVLSDAFPLQQVVDEDGNVVRKHIFSPQYFVKFNNFFR
jgi:hypothetical protein